MAACAGPDAFVLPQPDGPVSPVVSESIVSGDEVEGEPALSLSVDYAYGSPLLIDVHAPGRLVDTQLSTAPSVRVDAWRLTGPPDWPGEPHSVDEATVYVLRSLAQPDVLSTLDLLERSEFALLPAAGGIDMLIERCLPSQRAEPQLRFSGVLPTGVSAGFELAIDGPQLRDSNLSPEGGRLIVQHLGDRQLQLALEVTRHTHRSAAAGLPRTPEREVALLEPLTVLPGQALLVTVASPFAARGSWGFGMAVWLEGPTLPRGSLAAIRSQALTACVAALGSSQPFEPPAPAAPPTVSESPRGLGQQGQRRRALVELAAASDARLTLELARTASAEWLESLAAELAATQLTPVPSPAFGLHCERASLKVLSDDELRPFQRAILRRFAGGAALRLDWLRSTVNSLLDPIAFEAALVARNLDLLRDGLATVRCAAHTWLRARDLAPPGYDPLASREARRKLLQARRSR